MYKPNPIDTSKISLSGDITALSEVLARNTHEVWSAGRIKDGWTYGDTRDDKKKQHPCLVTYDELPESEKDYDRATATQTLKVIMGLGFDINKGLIESRQSIRKFKTDKPVTREQLNRLLEAAMFAPSACNTRPWEFIAITKRETLNAIANIHPYAKMCETATAAIIVVAIPQTGTMPEGYFPQDCAAATQNILLEAVSIGLGACWCGVYPKEERISSIRDLLKIPEPKIPFNVIAIGAPDESPVKRGFFEEAKVTYID